MRINIKGTTRQLLRKACARIDRKKIYAQTKEDPRSIPVFWSHENNFGDRITPDLLEYFGRFPVPTHPLNASVLGVGSLIQILKSDSGWSGEFLGTGLIEPHKLRLKKPSFELVRGHLTAELLGIEVNAVGDPGLLADILYTSNLTPIKAATVDIGFIPHYADLGHEWIFRMMENTKNVKLINPRQAPGDVAAQLKTCRRVVSSSLHGLIFCDALSINSTWATCGGRIVGGNFKFLDYFSSVSHTKRPHAISSPDDLRTAAENATLADTQKVTTVKRAIHQSLERILN